MRTTVNLDDDVLELVQRRAKLRRQSLGKALSEMVRRGLTAATPTQDKDGLVVFLLPADSPVVTTEDVRRHRLAAIGVCPAAVKSNRAST